MRCLNSRLMQRQRMSLIMNKHLQSYKVMKRERVYVKRDFPLIEHLLLEIVLLRIAT